MLAGWRLVSVFELLTVQLPTAFLLVSAWLRLLPLFSSFCLVICVLVCLNGCCTRRSRWPRVGRRRSSPDKENSSRRFATEAKLETVSVGVVLKNTYKNDRWALKFSAQRSLSCIGLLPLTKRKIVAGRSTHPEHYCAPFATLTGEMCACTGSKNTEFQTCLI